MLKEALESIAEDGLRLRVEFVWRGDRFGHLISMVAPTGQTMPLLESIEGTPADEWPASPPFQSLTIEDRPDGRTVALLVGMAGGSHWSASAEPVSGRAEIAFDVACRHKTKPNRLGSRYRSLS